ncbi:N-acetyltransferase family protein [Williamsia sp. M5A3_1d]
MVGHSIPLPPVRTAVLADAPVIAALRDDLARWMTANGIEQWAPGEITADDVAAQVPDGEWNVVEVDGRVAACIRLIWSDPLFWGADDAPAGYVHGLMVDRGFAGSGWGRELIEWSVLRTREAGFDLLRLDAVSHNPTLLAFYDSLGFRRVRLADLPAHFHRDTKVVLLERPI